MNQDKIKRDKINLVLVKIMNKETNWFDTLIIAIIFLSAILIGLETDKNIMDKHRLLFEIWRKNNFKSDNWNYS
jgi:hypothetical protein